jgi:hypothetical protein
MRRKGYALTRWADDWVITCKSHKEAHNALLTAQKVLEKLGVTLHPEKTKIVHIKNGFTFLGYKIQQGTRPLRLSKEKIRSGAKSYAVYAYPRQKSVDHFKEQIRARTRRRNPKKADEMIQELNPVIRGWGNYYHKAHVRRLFNRLDRWVLRRIWSHESKRWRNTSWKTLPERKLYGEMKLVNLISLIPSLATRTERNLMKAGCGKSARPV